MKFGGVGVIHRENSYYHTFRVQGTTNKPARRLSRRNHDHAPRWWYQVAGRMLPRTHFNSAAASFSAWQDTIAKGGPAIQSNGLTGEAFWFPNLRLLYVENRKAASTSVRSALRGQPRSAWLTADGPDATALTPCGAAFCGDRNLTNFKRQLSLRLRSNIHTRELAIQPPCMPSPSVHGTLTFTVVREPLSRFVSGYQHYLGMLKSYPTMREAAARAGFFAANGTMAQLLLANSYLDPHVGPQTNQLLLPGVCSPSKWLRFDAIVKLEAMSHGAARWLDGAVNVTFASSLRHENSGTKGARAKSATPGLNLSVLLHGHIEAIRRFCTTFYWDFEALEFQLPLECRHPSVHQTLRANAVRSFQQWLQRGVQVEPQDEAPS